jgi:hypothetical protein
MRSRKRGARSVEHLVRWNGQGLTGLELSETPLCFLEPKGLGVGVHLGVEARDQALRKPSALSRGELERLSSSACDSRSRAGFDIPRR